MRLCPILTLFFPVLQGAHTAMVHLPVTRSATMLVMFLAVAGSTDSRAAVTINDGHQASATPGLHAR